MVQELKGLQGLSTCCSLLQWQKTNNNKKKSWGTSAYRMQEELPTWVHWSWESNRCQVSHSNNMMMMIMITIKSAASSMVGLLVITEHTVCYLV